MPADEGKTESSKKRSQKKGRAKHKSKKKAGSSSNKSQTTNAVKNDLNSRLNKLTPANLSSLRWDDIQKDPILENDRIEQYKELRRQRYIDAQQQAIQKLVEKMKITIGDK